MSIRVVSPLLTSPAYISEGLDGSSPGAGGGNVEASPHLETLRIKLTLSGSRSRTVGNITEEESLSYTKEITYSRVPLPISAYNGLSRLTPATGIFELIDSPDTPIPAANEFQLATRTYGSVPMHMGWQNLQFTLYDSGNFASEVCGDWTYTDAGDPANDDSGDIEIDQLPTPWIPVFDPARAAPSDIFYGNPSGVVIAPSVLFTSYQGSMNEDISGWTNADWRAKTGVQTASYTQPSGGITSSVVANLEWELS